MTPSSRHYGAVRRRFETALFSSNRLLFNLLSKYFDRLTIGGIDALLGEEWRGTIVSRSQTKKICIFIDREGRYFIYGGRNALCKDNRHGENGAHCDIAPAWRRRLLYDHHWIYVARWVQYCVGER